MNRLVKLSTIIFYLFIFTHTANAQLIGVSADYPIDYSASKTGVVGSLVGITHPLPFIPNVGVTRFFFDHHDQGSAEYSLSTSVEVATLNFFYNLPVPFISLSVGLGTGVIQAVTDINQDDVGRVDTINSGFGVVEGFIRAGWAINPLVDIHFGLHSISTSDLELIKNTDVDVTGVREKENFSGNLSTIGVFIGF